MAEIFLTASVQVLMEKLVSPEVTTLVSQLVGNQKKYRKILEEWKKELKIIQAVLVDAEQNQVSNEAVKTWLADLQDVAFDMEDVLGDFDIQVQAREINMASASGVLGSIKNKVKRHTKMKPKNPDKINEITERLKNIQSQRQSMGLSAKRIMQHHTPPLEALRGQRESTSVPSKGKVLGRDEEKQKIVNELLKDYQSDDNFVVIPIVGKGGIGKTTLAQSVYNDEQLEGYFDLKAWVCVSDVFDVKHITTTICKVAVSSGTVVDFGTLDEAQMRLKEDLTSKKFLIVLDDIWNEEYDDWAKLRTPFQYAAKGSRVIMTTRNKEIARMMNNLGDNNIINLEVLSDNDCWCVFQQHASNVSGLVELQDDILRKCKGLPLAAKALGGLLKKTVDMKQCRMILENNPWSKEKGVLPVLRLSYHYLPFHLKRVFAYCSVLRKDYEFTEMEVILLWMAQGFLPENEECMEDLGNIYFDDLRSRSLFEQSPNSEKRFIMHDLIHDLALWAAGGNCYVTDTKDITQVDWQRIHHVFLTEDGRTTLESQLPMASQLRTFYCDYHRHIEKLNFIKDFRYIRTLRLASNTIKIMPKCIGELQHLRFLRLSFERIKELPTSIGNLWNLQTLWLEDCYYLEKVPHISDLNHLRFFSLESTTIKELPKSISNLWNLRTLCLNYCFSLEKVPNIGSLEKLRHLEILETSLKEMPMGFEKVTNLRSLENFVLGHGCGARVRELKDLNHLEGTLTIHGLENVSMSENAREAQLHKKCWLDELYLKWGTGRDEVDDNTKREVLEQLKPRNSIKRCDLDGYRGLAFPSWLGDPCFNNMVHISLRNCVKCECLPPLGQLPQLEYLWIRGMDGIVHVSLEFYGNLRCTNPFPTLKSLRFENMKSWGRWLPFDNDRAFPRLESLIILGCNSLQGDVPSHLPSLKRLEITYCKELSFLIPLESLPSLEKLQIENSKIRLITTEGASKEEHGLPPSSKGNTPCELPHLTTLTIIGSPSLISFPNGLLLPALETLYIKDCRNMESLPSEMHKYSSLQSLCVKDCPKIQYFAELGLPNNLKTLDITQLNIDRLHSLSSSLFKLYIEDFPNLKSISCSTLPNLTELDIGNCPELETFEDDILPPQLHCLWIYECPKLQFFLQGGLPNNLKILEIIHVKLNQPIQAWGLQRLHSLQMFTLKKVDTEEDLSLPSSMSEIRIEGNQNMKNLSVVDGTTLTRLSVQGCPKLESVVGSFTSLSRLLLWSCPKLESLPEVGLPLNLKDLVIRDGVSIDKPIREWGLHLLTSLQDLTLYNIGRCTDLVERIPSPDGLELPSSLSQLIIVGFQNLKSISCSPLPNLISLWIECCPKFESFDENALPPRLERVLISECDFLKPRLKRDPHGLIRMDDETWSLR